MELQPILHPDNISMREGDPFVQTRFFQYDKHALLHLLLLLALIAAAFLLIVLGESKVFAVIFVIILFGLPILAGSVKTIFSFNAIDDRLLIMEREGIQVGDEFFRITEIRDIALHIDAFDGFRYRRSGSGGRVPSYESSFGNNNRLWFTYQGKAYTFKFILGRGTAWLAMYQLIDEWTAAGLKIRLSETYRRDFILDVIAHPEKVH